MRIRNSAKAVIVKNSKLLVVEINENSSTYYILPGGGQEPGENLHQALTREVKVEVEIGELLFVSEYIGKNHEFSSYHSHVHQTEFMFLCDVKENNFYKGSSPDKGQIGTRWLPILDYKLFPQALKTYLISYFIVGLVQIYIGDIN